jgi:hypothetical protein
LRVVAERWDAGNLVEEPLLTLSFDGSSSPLASQTLTFLPVDRPGQRVLTRDIANGAALRAQLLSENAWVILVTNNDTSESQLGRMFDEAGIVGDPPSGQSGPLSGSPRAAAQALADAFGGEPEQTTFLTAVRADYEIRIPGKPPHAVSRYLFDSLGAQARTGGSIPRPSLSETERVDRGLCLAALYDTLVTFASLPADVYVYRLAQRLIDAKSDIESVASGSTDEATRLRANRGLSVRSLELYAAMRDSEMDPSLAVAEPQILRREIHYRETSGDSLGVDVVGDLAWNRLAPAIASVAPSAILTQGVLDTLLESAIALQNGPMLPAQATAALFDEARRQNIDAVAVRRTDDDVLMAMPVETRLRVRADLQNELIVVVPRKPVMIDGQPRLGWWRVDPRTAQTVGAMDTGRLQFLVKYLLPLVPGGALVLHRVVASPQAIAWANQMTRLRIETTENQWALLVAYAQSLIDKGLALF